MRSRVLAGMEFLEEIGLHAFEVIRNEGAVWRSGLLSRVFPRDLRHKLKQTRRFSGNPAATAFLGRQIHE